MNFESCFLIKEFLVFFNLHTENSPVTKWNQQVLNIERKHEKFQLHCSQSYEISTKYKIDFENVLIQRSIHLGLNLIKCTHVLIEQKGLFAILNCQEVQILSCLCIDYAVLFSEN